MDSVSSSSGSPHVVEISAQNFQAEVVDKSKQVPVLLEFYANEAEESQQLAPVLQKLAAEYGGKFSLARVDIRENQQLVQQLQIRTLPTIKIIFQGQMADNLEGPQDEARLRDILDQLTMSPIEMIRGQIDELVAQGQRPMAIQLLQQAIQQEPANHALQAELADLLVMENRVDEARQIIAGVPEDTDGIAKARSRIEFIDMAKDLPPVEQLASDIESASDPSVRINLAIRLVADDQVEPALEHLLEALKQDRAFDEELARRTMIKVFDLLGKGNELATAYRRKMFTFLY